ncbi:hypothetical protein HDK64DRAFT_342288 [Phyllosticta capitalensis]
MRPKTYESLHILLGLSPQASAAELILAAERETGKTQHALDTLLRLRTQNERHSYEFMRENKDTNSDPKSFGFFSQEPTTKAGEHKATSHSSNDPNILQPNMQSHGRWQSLRKLKHRASALFPATKSLMSLNPFMSFSKVSSMSFRPSDITSTSSLTSISSLDCLDGKTRPSPRKSLNIPSGGDHRATMPIICGLKVGGCTLHLNCPPPCRNVTTLSQFPCLPDDDSVSHTDSTNEDHSVSDNGSTNENYPASNYSTISGDISGNGKPSIHAHGCTSGKDSVNHQRPFSSDDSDEEEYFVNDQGQVISDFSVTGDFAVNDEEAVIGDISPDDDQFRGQSVHDDDIVFDRTLLEDIFNRSRRIRPRGTVFGLFPGQN